MRDGRRLHKRASFVVSNTKRPQRSLIRLPLVSPSISSVTLAGEYTDPFTLQYVAGHDNIKTTMRCVHAQEAAVLKLFASKSGVTSRCKNRCSSVPSQAELSRLLVTGSLPSAEVVELADTPS
jgi:hypothetical protein